MGQVNFGILGTGSVAHDFVNGLRTVPGACAAAVGSRSIETARQFAARFGIRSAYGSYDDLVRDSDVDVVYVASPTHRHVEDALRCLGAGKSVLVEKPFAPNSAGANRIIDAARRSNLFCMEAMWMRFVPGFRRAVSRINSGEIGEPRMLFADFGTPEIFDAHNHRYSKEGGGAWLDRGVYGVSLAVQLFGEPDEVSSCAVLGETGSDIQSSAVMKFSNGRLAVVSASTSAYTANEAVVAGTTGRLRLAEIFIRPEILFSRDAPSRSDSIADQSHGVTLKDQLKSYAFVRRVRSWAPREASENVPYDGNGYGHEAAEVVRCLKAGLTESPLMTWDDTLAVVRVNDRVRACWHEVDPGAS